MTDIRKVYPSDITREQFEVIRYLLESVKKKTRPRVLDLYDVFCGILYVLKEGCRWESVPKDYPDYRRLHYYFTIWKNSGVLEEVLKKIGWRYSYKQWSERESIVYHS